MEKKMDRKRAKKDIDREKNKQTNKLKHVRFQFPRVHRFLIFFFTFTTVVRIIYMRVL